MLKGNGQSLADYLANEVFADAKGRKQLSGLADIAGFERFIENYKRALAAENVAIIAY